MSNKKSGNKLKTLLALTAVLYVTAKVNGSKSSERSYTSQGGEDDDDTPMEKEFININYDISELVDVDDALDEIPTFELAVFRLEKLMYDGMGADFIEGVKEICKDSKSEKKKNLNYTDKEIDDYIETAEFYYNQAKEDIKTGKTKYKLYIDDPAKISLSLRGLKNVLEYIIEFIESSEHIIRNPKADSRIKKLILECYKPLRRVLRLIINMEVALAKKLKRSGNEVNAKKIEKVLDELEQKGK